jgi:hypothetical protein
VSANIKKLKFGFVNLTLDFLDEDDLKMAQKLAADAKDYLEKELFPAKMQVLPRLDSGIVTNLLELPR